jgi:integrase
MRGSIIRRGRNSWRIKFDVAAVDGKRQTRYVTVRGTKAQAQSEAAKIIAATATSTYVDLAKESVREFAERWLRDWASNNVSNKTWTRYAQLLRKHLIIRLGSVSIQKLRAADLQAAYAAMAEQGLADRTRLHLHRVVHRMLGHALQWGVVARNVSAMVDAPRVRAHEIEILTPAEVKTVLERLRNRSAISHRLGGTGNRHAARRTAGAEMAGCRS